MRIYVYVRCFWPLTIRYASPCRPRGSVYARSRGIGMEKLQEPCLRSSRCPWLAHAFLRLYGTTGSGNSMPRHHLCGCFSHPSTNIGINVGQHCPDFESMKLGVRGGTQSPRQYYIITTLGTFFRASVWDSGRVLGGQCLDRMIAFSVAQMGKSGSEMRADLRNSNLTSTKESRYMPRHQMDSQAILPLRKQSPS